MYTRARLEILHWILNFSTFKYFSPGSFSRGDKDYSFHECNDRPPIGSLCMLTSAPVSKWYLSWLVEIDNPLGPTKYLFKSIEDGSLCWWSNVGVMHYSPETVAKFPSWKWIDRQFKFNDQWYRACYRKRGAYIVKPAEAVFEDDGSVTLSTRIKFDFSPQREFKKFPNYKKVKVSEMLAFYDEAVASYEKTIKE